MPDQNLPLGAILVEIQLLVLEDNDLEAVAALGVVGDALRDEASTLNNYRLLDVVPTERVAGHKTRGEVELFHLVANFLQNMQSAQNVGSLLSASGLTALWLLLKQRRVKKVEVKIGNKMMVIENADQHVVEKSLKLFEEMCKQESNTLTPDAIVEMKAHVSKRSTTDKKGQSDKKDKSDKDKKARSHTNKTPAHLE